MLPVALYGRKTWSLTLREKRRLKVFENRVLRRIFGPKRDEVTEEWRKLHTEELNDLYSPIIVRVIKIEKNEMGGACSVFGGEERRLQVVRKPVGKRPLRRPRLRLEDNIQVDLQEVGCGDMNWIGIGTGGVHL
jgi:hypothetical protein